MDETKELAELKSKLNHELFVSGAIGRDTTIEHIIKIFKEANYHKALSSPELEKKIEDLLNSKEIWHMVKNTYGEVTIDEPILRIEYLTEQLLSLLSQSTQDIKLTAIYLEELIKEYDEYIKLLDDEFNEVVSLAISYGWKSHRFEEGAKLRKAIEDSKAQLAHNLKEIGK